MTTVSATTSATTAATAAPKSTAPSIAAGGCVPTKSKSLPKSDPTKVGGASDASKGVEQIKGGGSTSLLEAVKGLAEAVKRLAEVVAKLKSGSNVAGVNGGAASRGQYVAPVAIAAASVRRSEDGNMEQRVLELVNAERAKYGLAALTYNAVLDQSAEKHADHMSIVGRMAHSGIGDGDPGERIRAEGWRRSWGENVATGQTSAEQVVREWMNSPTHRANILNPNFRYLGVSYETSSTGRSYWAQSFGA
jgi:uncharacterized protein YkwD